ncbi:hypothetical protein D3C75_303990 [compost metagenome]
MNHNDLLAFSEKCEGVVIDLPHSGRGCRLRPHPRRRNRPPDPVGTCAAAAPQWQCSALLVPVGSVLLSHPTPLALHQRRRAMPNGPPLCRPIATSPLIRINAASKCELARTFNGTSSAGMLLCGVVGTITEMRLRRFMRASAAKVGERRSPSWVAAKRFSGGPGRWTAQGPLQVRPCKLGRRIHAAHAPAQPIYPATDTFLWRPPTQREKKSKEQQRVAAL